MKQPNLFHQAVDYGFLPFFFEVVEVEDQRWCFLSHFTIEDYVVRPLRQLLLGCDHLDRDDILRVFRWRPSEHFPQGLRYGKVWDFKWYFPCGFLWLDFSSFSCPWVRWIAREWNASIFWVATTLGLETPCWLQLAFWPWVFLVILFAIALGIVKMTTFVVDVLVMDGVSYMRLELETNRSYLLIETS